MKNLDFNLNLIRFIVLLLIAKNSTGIYNSFSHKQSIEKKSSSKSSSHPVLSNVRKNLHQRDEELEEDETMEDFDYDENVQYEESVALNNQYDTNGESSEAEDGNDGARQVEKMSEDMVNKNVNKSQAQSNEKIDVYEFEANESKPKKKPGAPKGPRAPKILPKLTIVTRRASGSDRENESTNHNNDSNKVFNKKSIQQTDNNEMNQPSTSDKPATIKKSSLQRQNSTTRTSSYITKEYSNQKQIHNKYDT